MRRNDLLKSTPFRLAILFTSLFLASFVVAGLLAYQIILGDLRERLDRNLDDTFQLISRSLGDNDLEDLTGTVQSYAAASQDHDRVFFLADLNGVRLAGNIDKANVPLDRSTVDGTAFGLPVDGQFRALRGSVAGNLLVIGMSFDDTEELGKLALTSMAWAGGLAGIIAIVAGVLLAGAVQGRMQAIANTLASVGQGQLTARIPLRGSGDDVDILAGQVNAALDRLAALVEGMRQVSVDIAHDLKTPLNRLSMTVEAALEKAEAAATNVDELLRAQEECQQINTTFEALLRIAQLESGARRSRFVAVSINDVVGVIAEAYSSVAEENGQSLDYRPLSGSVSLWGDRDLLTQMVANLVENAIRHGGKKIGLALNATPQAVSIVVTDDGPGVPEHEREKVFQRLYRLDKSRSTPGTGLGLSLVKAIADLHGARIEMEDMKPGLVVRVVVPLGSSFDPLQGSDRSPGAA